MEFVPHARHVLYVDLPQGQVSFHSTAKYAGPSYDGDWDGQPKSEQRILECADNIMGGFTINTTFGPAGLMAVAGHDEQGGMQLAQVSHRTRHGSCPRRDIRCT